MKYKILHNYIYGWDEACLDDNEKPVLFDTEKEAQENINDLIEDVEEAVKLGHMSDVYYKEDYRIVPSSWRSSSLDILEGA